PPRTTRSPPSEPEWEDITEKQVDESDSSDDEYTTSRAGRQGLAQALFGNIMGGSSPSTSRPGSAAPQAPKEPPKALANLGGGNPEQGRGALLSAIQGGARLKKAQTVDKSGPPGVGKVIGDAAPPSHIQETPREHAPPSPEAAPAPVEERAPSPAPPSEDSFVSGNPNRQSIDWYAGLAADASHPAASVGETSMLEPPQEEEEEKEQDGYEQIEKPHVQIEGEDDLEEFDFATTIRVRALYEFVGTRDVDLSFKEDVVIEAHPAKDESSPWWYGTVVKDGSKGWFPKNYVEHIQAVHAKAIYSYAAGDPDQLPFAEGDILEVVDRSENDWWKVENTGIIFLVPAAYLEVIDGVVSAHGARDGNLGVSPEPAAPTDTDAQPMSTIPEVTNAMEQLKLPAEGYQGAEISDSLQPTEDSHRLSVHSIPPPLRSRPRAISTLSIASTAMSHTPSFITDNEEDEGESSSDDSILSFWSSDESSSESEDVNEPEEEPPTDDRVADIEKPKKERRAAPKPPKKETDAEKEVERKKREEQRQAILAATGLQLKREPSGAPAQRFGRVVSRRRPAPNVPGRKKRHAPAVPEGKSKKLPSLSSKELQSGRLETGDAYARYEAFLAQSAQVQSKPLPRPEPVRAESRPSSQVLSPQLSGPAEGAALSSASTTTSLPTSTLSLGKETGGKITGFFKSMMAPHGHEPKRPSISGPTITRVDEPPASPAPGSGIFTSSEEVDAGFGKTWSSLVEPSVLETMDKRERKRQEAIFEFIATEIGYNRDLQLIVEVFYASLLPLLDEKALTVIFANIEDILLFNTGFLSALEERQKAARLYIDRIGDVLSFLNEAGVYMTYCVNQHQAIKLLQSLREEKPELDVHLRHIQATNSSIRGLDLSHYLLIPMQRITRYPLLIKQIIAYTPYDSSDLPPLQSVLHAVEGIVSRINESVREAEGQERLRVLSENLWIGGEGRLDLTAPTAFLGPRKLIKEGPISKAKSGRKLSMVLCNDIIVLLEDKSLYRMPLALHEVEVRQTRDSTGFALKADQRRGGDTIALRAASASDAKDWMRKIDKARKRVLTTNMFVG
ncbi:hypothetical protein J004_04452, partial [Cryptococcus neoformans]